MSAASTLSPLAPLLNVEKQITLPPEVKNWPFKQTDFHRQDTSSDSLWYAQPRFVTHIDDACIEALTNVYSQILQPNDAVLDLCSSWISHFPAPSTTSLGNVIGLGLNQQELAANRRLSSFVVQDLNTDPTLPFDDNSFDVITNAVSVDYLAQPKQIFQEMFRTLKPNGTAVMAFSNRMFPTKVVDIWLRVNEEERVRIVETYFVHCGANFENVAGYKMITGNGGDPLYVVLGQKPGIKEQPTVEEEEEGKGGSRSTL